MDSRSREYLHEYGLLIQKFGAQLGFQNPKQPVFVFNPAVGGDLHNLLLLTDPTTIIFMTDFVPMDYRQLTRKPLQLSAEEEKNAYLLDMALKGESDVSVFNPMHVYFIHRLSAMGYVIKLAEQQPDGVIHLSIEREGVKRELYYLEVDHKKEEDHARLLSSLKRLVPSSHQFVYFQKALEDHVESTPVYRAFLRSLKLTFPKSRFLIDGSKQSYPHDAQPIMWLGLSSKLDGPFCYGDKIWVVREIPSEAKLLAEAFSKEIDKMKAKLNAHLKNVELMDLLKVFDAHVYQELAILAQENRYENFKTKDEVWKYLDEIKDFLKNQCEYFMESMQLSMMEQIHEKRTPVVVKHMTRQKRSAAVLWERIGLGEAFQAVFPKEEDFWQSMETPTAIYRKLVAKKYELERTPRLGGGPS